MSRLWVLALALAAGAILASPAAAGDDGAYPPVLPNLQTGPVPSTGQTGGVNGGSRKSLGSKFTGKRCAKSRRVTTCYYYKQGHVRKRCVTVGKRTTCVHYTQRGRPYKRCVRKRPGGKFRCRPIKRGGMQSARGALGVETLALKGALAPGKRARLPKSWLGLNGEGFGSDIAAVGAIWIGNEQHCSGTLVGVGIVLTAGHCIYDLTRGSYETPSLMTFAPGQSVLPDYGNLLWQPYGSFQVRDLITTSEFTNGDAGYDWGFMLLAPDANGYYPGQYTGTWPFYKNIDPIGRGWLAGYPSEGYWTRYDYYSGHAQYHADATWDGDLLLPGFRGLTNYHIGWHSKMTGGSSGGPVIEQLQNGEWAIGGVINWLFTEQCLDNSCRGTPGLEYWSRWETSAYFNDGIEIFWHAALRYWGLE
jgi:hypothetical protein